MALKDMFKKKYTTNCWCNNCSTHQELQVPRGISVAQFIESGTGKCGNCGCNTLVADYNQIDEFRQTTARQHQQQKQQQRRPSSQQVKVRNPNNPLRRRQQSTQQPLRRAPLPQKRPSNRPANLPRPQKQQTQPIEPDFRPKGVFRNDIDFWTGKPQKGDEENENY